MAKITPILPGMTDEVKVPAFANLIDSVIEFKAVFKRPKNKKESRELKKASMDIHEKLYQNSIDREEKIKDMTESNKDAKTIKAGIKKIIKDAETGTEEINELNEKLARKWFIRFEELKLHEDDEEDIKCTKEWIDAMFVAPGYSTAIGTALNDLMLGKKREEYEAGN